MVIYEKKQVKKVSHKKKCSEMPLSPVLSESGETPAVHRLADPEGEEISVDSVLSCPFRKVCGYLKELDKTSDCELVTEIILHFSLLICGLPECRPEDLPLAVYLFIEDTFGIQSRIELCARLQDDRDPGAIGVVFETIRMKYNVLKNDALLEGAEVRMKDNKDIEWILEAMD